MPDDGSYYPPEDDNLNPDDSGEFHASEGSGNTPASVVFMEMMRQQAARSTKPSHAPEHVTPGPPTRREAVYEELSPEAAQQRYQTALEEQRIRRVQRRRTRRRRQTVGMMGGFIRTLFIVIVAAGLLGTIFSFWTDSQYFKQDVRAGLQVAIATNQVTVQPTDMPTPPWLRKIGVVSGHRGPERDPGAVCPDGLTENEINFNIAQLVVRNLRGLGYSVDLLDEFDPRLDNYQAAALISIHSNTCEDYGEYVSGFLVAKASARPQGGEDDRLAECIAEHYMQASGLGRRDTLTVDMTNYHTFREIHPLTPAAIIELGFMLADRPLLTGQPDLLARGITDGVLCFLEPGQSPTSEPATPDPATPPPAN